MTEGKRPEDCEDFIEKIVRDVLGRLSEAQERMTDGADKAGHTKVYENQPTPPVFNGRVVSAEALIGKLQGISELHVERGAVVTPAAHDALLHAAIRLVRAGSGESIAGQFACRLVVGVAASAVEPSAVVRLADVHCGSIQHIARVGLIDVVQEMVEQIVLGGGKGLLFTDKQAAAVCLANRTRGVRAVAARCIEDVETGAASVGANVLAIGPRGLSTWQQLQMTRTFLACSAACPTELAAALS